MTKMFEQFKWKFPHLKERLDGYAEKCERLEVPARTMLLREGEISRRCLYVEEGCLRVWFNDQGKDVTFQFCFENQGLSSIESFLKHTPSMFTIETIEPSVISVLKMTDFEAIMQELQDDPAVLREAINILFNRQLHYMREFLSFIKDTPKQRYLDLVAERPHIVQRIPQHYVASYLGITPVHLSRIRNGLLRENRI